MSSEMSSITSRSPRAAEFFAGIGLVRRGLEEAGIQVAWANDISPVKRALYTSNVHSPEEGAYFELRDVWEVKGEEIPPVDLVTASSPCTDLSLAGWRTGLSGPESSAVWGFVQALGNMRPRPQAVMLENVVGLATSHSGADLRALIVAFNGLGYSCDIFAIDAAHFVPQSRPRLFVIGLQDPPRLPTPIYEDDWLRPTPIRRFLHANGDLVLHRVTLAPPPKCQLSLAQVVERLPATSTKWWPMERLDRFVGSLAPLQHKRLEALRETRDLTWRTAYRRTRDGVAKWEIRNDAISGCLRTARGGSSKQALVEAGQGAVRIRWMTPREYARLMGASDFRVDAVTENQALFGLGDAVCVPVITWIAERYLMPHLCASAPDEDACAG